MRRGGGWGGGGWESSTGEFGTCVWVPLKSQHHPTHRSIASSDDETSQVDAVRILHVQNFPFITAGRLRVDGAFGNHIRALQRAGLAVEEFTT